MSKHFELMEQAANPEYSSAEIPPPEQDWGGETGYRESVKQSSDGEVFSLVRQVFLLPARSAPRVVVFAGIESICSRMCLSVAEALAGDIGRRVCLVDGNLRSPSLSSFFGMANRAGFADALHEPGEVHRFISRLPQENLWLFPAGSPARNSAALLSGERLSERLEELQMEFDVVLMDAPPLNQHSDGLLLGQASHGVVLVLQADTTRRGAASTAVSQLRSANVPILAAVLNRRTLSGFGENL